MKSIIIARRNLFSVSICRFPVVWQRNACEFEFILGKVSLTDRFATALVWHVYLSIEKVFYASDRQQLLKTNDISSVTVPLSIVFLKWNHWDSYSSRLAFVVFVCWDVNLLWKMIIPRIIQSRKQKRLNFYFIFLLQNFLRRVSQDLFQTRKQWWGDVVNRS